jgi:hypothetical protein
MNKESVNYRREMLNKYFPKDSVGAEIGVYRGSFSRTILDSVKPKSLYLIDAWSSDLCDANNYLTQDTMNKMYDGVVKRFENNSEIKIIRKSSLDALEDFEDESLDWIYIDASHDYDNVKLDILNWHKKVKIEGYIFGDDYNSSRSGSYKDGVIRGVHSALHELESNIKIVETIGNQYILIRKIS